MSASNDNINQQPGCNQPQAPKSKTVESVDDASAQKPLNTSEGSTVRDPI